MVSKFALIHVFVIKKESGDTFHDIQLICSASCIKSEIGDYFLLSFCFRFDRML